MDDDLRTLETVKYIRQYGLAQLLGEFKLSQRRHSKYPNLVQLRYDQIRSPFFQEIVQECRGLILDENNNWNVVCYPYKKFFNLHEPYAATLDWRHITVFEKLDGSIATLYHYRGEWHVSSSSVPDGAGNLFDSTTFADLFWSIWRKLNYQFPEDRNKVFIFEMLSIKHVIVVRPEEEALILHGVRNMSTFEEEDPAVSASRYNWQLVPTYQMSTREQILECAAALNPVKSEGYIVRDRNWNRVKIKAPAYVALTHLSKQDKKGLNKKHLLQIIRLNESDEFLSYFPDYKDLHEIVKEKYDHLCDRIRTLYNKVIEALKSKEEQDNIDATIIRISSNPANQQIIKKMLEQKESEPRILFAHMDINDLLKLVEDEITPNNWKIDKLSIYDNPVGMVTKSKKKKKLDNQPFQIDDSTLVIGKQHQSAEISKQTTPSKTTVTTTKSQKKKPTKAQKSEEDLDALLAHFKMLDAKAAEKKPKK